MGMREAAGKRPLSVAGGGEREQCGDASGRVGDAGERVGRGASQAAPELAAARSGSIKHFFAFMFKKNWLSFDA
jgi:hypothetical protein